LLLGCSSQRSERSELLRKGDQFYDAYLDGDVTRARQSLEQANQLFQSPHADILEPRGHAAILYFNYARLYALENRVGDKAAAEAALIKARFWNLRRYELAGDATNSARMDEWRVFGTPEKVVEVADKLDNAASKGKGPKYIQGLQKR
jgi:hypothetical protein